MVSKLYPSAIFFYSAMFQANYFPLWQERITGLSSVNLIRKSIVLLSRESLLSQLEYGVLYFAEGA